MDKTVIESYAIRFKKKRTYLPSKDNFGDMMLDRKMKGDYLYFNPTRPGLDKFGQYPYIADCQNLSINELKNLWNFCKKSFMIEEYGYSIFMKQMETYFDMYHPQIVKIQITRTTEIMEEIIWPLTAVALPACLWYTAV